VLGGSGSGLKRDAGAANERRVGSVKERVNPYCAGKPVCRTFA
jgi:hypothetical protein